MEPLSRSSDLHYYRFNFATFPMLCTGSSRRAPPCRVYRSLTT